MYKLIRTTTIAVGKGQTAMEWAHSVNELIHSKYGLNIQAHMGLFADIGNIVWIVELESMAHLEEITARLNEDADYQKLIKASWEHELFTGTNDRLIQGF